VQLTPMEIVELGRSIEAIERREAAKRVGGRPKKGTETGGNLPPVSTGKTRDKVGQALGVSGKTDEKLKAVKANGVPELIAHPLAFRPFFAATSSSPTAANSLAATASVTPRSARANRDNTPAGTPDRRASSRSGVPASTARSTAARSTPTAAGSSPAVAMVSPRPAGRANPGTMI
jgi:hypothetical protein